MPRPLSLLLACLAPLLPLRAQLSACSTLVSAAGTTSVRTHLTFPAGHGNRMNLAVYYIDTVDTASGPTTSLEEVRYLTLTKTEPKDCYPLRYLHTVRTLGSGSLAYRAYAVETPRRDYTLTCAIQRGATPLGSFTLSPSAPAIATYGGDGHPIVAKLLGEAGPAVAKPVATGCVLYVAEGSSVADGLLIPPDQAASILDARQLKQLQDEDTQRHAANPEGSARYLVKWKGDFRRAAQLGDMNAALLLVARNRDARSSMISLEIDKALVETRIMESVGYMPYAYGGNFADLSGDGAIHIGVKNFGGFDADYRVVVRDGSPGLGIPVASACLALAHDETQEVVLPVYNSQSTPGGHSCWIDLMAPNGTLYDSVQVNFDTTAMGTLRKR